MRTSRVTVPEFREKKARGERIAVLTAYDATMAGCSTAVASTHCSSAIRSAWSCSAYDSTVPVTLDDMIHHTRAVVRGSSRALVIADMPFLTYQAEHRRRRAQRRPAAFRKVAPRRSSSKAASPVLDAVERLVDIGIPVMGHLGLLPQSVHQIGGYRKQATTPAEADRLIADARGAGERRARSPSCSSRFRPTSRRTVTTAVKVPTIGIGAGPDCDGQVLVSYDMLGLFDGFVPSFVKQYAHLADDVVGAARTYVDEVKQQAVSSARGIGG